MKITQDENELLMQLVGELAIPELDPSKHVTPQILGKALGISDKAARVKLEERYKAGELDRIKVRTPSGKWAYAYLNIQQKE